MTKQYLSDMAVRAVRTFAQTLAGAVAVGATFQSVDWVTALQIAGMAALASVLNTLSKLGEDAPKAPEAPAAPAAAAEHVAVIDEGVDVAVDYAPRHVVAEPAL